ncbi:MAG: glycosyltransferase family 4 protein [Jaaginema sp. PMC 1079.18]|nr:glycosyltransferase family 4 protein [Jaaginema sp. PMC 1080.18]MEC4850301.1 glycosyltransferase family 4 protein [Jaaginema sp. PMC 1079.18]MEC4865871.1 glycosyltransferase family 4 protein [Jaaginema sp. PMC 1078.18]
MKKIALIHPTGNPFARNAAIAFSERGQLACIITTLAYNPQSPLSQILQTLPQSLATPLQQEFNRRTWIVPPGVSLHTYPTREILRIALMRLGWSQRFGGNPQPLVDWVYRTLDAQVARNHLDNIAAVYAYEDGAALTFTAAKAQGLACYYDLPIVFHRHSEGLQAEEAARFPELAPALLSLQEPPEKRSRKDQEARLADRIIVPSSIVKQSLLDAQIPAEKIAVIPFGAPVDYFHPKPKPDKLFRALFVGRLGPRKGVHYLLQAWQELHLSDAELLCVGFNEFPQSWLSTYTDTFRYISSVPHTTLNQYYSQASVFVFPSLIEGLALVLLEAMACGIPLITTVNAGGADIITDGVEGFLIPPRDTEALKAKLEWCYSHPEALANMGAAARRQAETLTWDLYRQRLQTHCLGQD